jgi:hypothetical protein
MEFKSQKSVFQFGNEYACTNFFDVDTQASGVDVSLDGEHIGSIIGISVPEDIDDIDEQEKFDDEVITWIVDNDK